MNKITVTYHISAFKLEHNRIAEHRWFSNKFPIFFPRTSVNDFSVKTKFPNDSFINYKSICMHIIIL